VFYACLQCLTVTKVLLTPLRDVEGNRPVDFRAIAHRLNLISQEAPPRRKQSVQVRGGVVAGACMDGAS